MRDSIDMLDDGHSSFAAVLDICERMAPRIVDSKVGQLSKQRSQ